MGIVEHRHTANTQHNCDNFHYKRDSSKKKEGSTARKRQEAAAAKNKM